jgi:hypothetical protein
MDAGEPRARRRGFFFHVETPDLDATDHDSADGISVRLRVGNPSRDRSSLTPGRKAVTSSVRALIVTSSEPDLMNGHRSGKSVNGNASHRLARSAR